MENNRSVFLRQLRLLRLLRLVLFAAALLLCVNALTVLAAAAADAQVATATSNAAPAGTPSGVSDPNYKLGSGDSIRVIVYGQPDLSGVFRVDGNGKVALPLVGTVDAGGKSVNQFEQGVTGALKPDYLQDPRVSVEVLTYRPFYIVGEVQKPGNYPYTDGMTVINAVAMAGGFTYRAKNDDFVINRANAPSDDDEEADQNTKVHPGDVITVPERWF